MGSEGFSRLSPTQVRQLEQDITVEEFRQMMWSYQGDPLSPSLLDIVMQGLSVRFKRESTLRLVEI